VGSAWRNVWWPWSLNTVVLANAKRQRVTCVQRDSVKRCGSLMSLSLSLSLSLPLSLSLSSSFSLCLSEIGCLNPSSNYLVRENLFAVAVYCRSWPGSMIHRRFIPRRFTDRGRRERERERERKVKGGKNIYKRQVWGAGWSGCAMRHVTQPG